MLRKGFQLPLWPLPNQAHKSTSIGGKCRAHLFSDSPVLFNRFVLLSRILQYHSTPLLKRFSRLRSVRFSFSESLVPFKRFASLSHIPRLPFQRLTPFVRIIVEPVQGVRGSCSVSNGSFLFVEISSLSSGSLPVRRFGDPFRAARSSVSDSLIRFERFAKLSSPFRAPRYFFADASVPLMRILEFASSVLHSVPDSLIDLGRLSRLCHKYFSSCRAFCTLSHSL